jgi:parallel beta-helix repeat protein
MRYRVSNRIASLFVSFILVFTIFSAIDFYFEIAPRASGITIYVDDDGGADYMTIQEGIDAAGDGDTVYVYSGVYYENVDIGSKSITLTGENRDTTIIDGSGGDFVIYASPSRLPVTIQKFTIKNASQGIHYFQVENGIITDNKINSMSEIGIYSWGAGYNIISNNIISDCETAIACTFDTVKNNVINNCEIGISISDMHAFIYNNDINVNGFGIEFYDLFCTRSVISQNNTVNGEPVYHFFDVHGTPGSPIILQNLPTGNSNISNLGKITFVDCSYIKVTDNNICDNFPGSGITVYFSDNITIDDNLIEGNTGFYPFGPPLYQAGIQILGSKDIIRSKNHYNVTIIDNNISENIYSGAQFPNISELKITRNNITNNGDGGIGIDGSDISISSNNITNNSNDGIQFSGSYISIIENNITNNTNGIRFEGRAYYGDIDTNFISNNTIGIYFDSSSSPNNARYINVTDNTIGMNSVGMHLKYARNNIISNNKIISCVNVGVKSRYYSRYNVYSNNMIESDKYGFEFYLDTDNTCVNNSISGGINDIYFSGIYTSHVTLLNCSFNKSKVYYSIPESTLTVQWYLHVNVTESLGQPIPNAIVCIKDSLNSLPVQKYRTDTQGYARWLVETEYMEQDVNGDTIGEKTYHTPHKITAWNETMLGFTETNMNESKEVNIVMDTPFYEIQLYKGWNLISLPLVQSNTSLSTILISIAGNYDKVQWFNASDGKWHSTDDDLTDLDRTMGFYIYMNTDDALVVTGDIPNSTMIQLYKGWNLVGNPSFCNHEIDEILDSITGNYTTVQWYNSYDKSNPWKNYNINKPAILNDLKYITCGRGYWIYLNVDCVWEIINL